MMPSAKKTNQTMKFPLLPLRDVVVFPHMVIPLFVGRTESIKALEMAMDQEKQIFLVAQKDPAIDVPKQDDIFPVGTIATVLQMLRLPDGTVKVLVEGSVRARTVELFRMDDFFAVTVKLLEEEGSIDDPEIKSLMRSLSKQFERMVKVNKKIPQELLTSLSSIQDPGRLADSIAAHMTIKIELRQQILEALDIKQRLELVHQLLGEELEMVEVDKLVQSRVKRQVDKSQREYYLSEKMKAIQQELGELKEAPDELTELKNRIEAAGMPKEVEAKATSEHRKLLMMPAMSAEATVVRNYLDTLLSMPWKKRSKVSRDLEKAEAILEADHYGLKEVKERILEYLAVQQRVKKLKGPILCLVGPPGVGKTSLGQSIANATGRKFIRVSLGGVRDEAEIRGHRRTYIGAMCGKILQQMSRVGVRNPLFMLDEVDKMAMDFRGDPASALLEVLDPEQNHSFNDHYLEVDYDLSDVMFIATSNSMNIPPPLLDRMEVIRLAGYTEDEKLNIAKRYLILRQLEQNGLLPNEIKMTDGAVREIIRSYTREAGVRNLERAISKICRKVVRDVLVSKKKKQVASITRRNIGKYLGVKRYRFGLAEEKDQVGQVTGLAWTEVGGELLTIEAQVMPGKGKSLHTGRLGDVMRESIHAAMTVVRSRASLLGIEDDYFQKHDFHVHVPEGATPKDGPSAGIGMCSTLISAITQIPVRCDVAMTGEITLRGEVLPIGGLKEKLLAALRGGIKEVIIPEENKKDLKEIPKEVTESLNIHPVRWIDQVFDIALQGMPEALVKARANIMLAEKGKKSTTKSSRERTH